MIITEDMVEDFKILFPKLALDDNQVKRGLGVIFGGQGLFDGNLQMADGGDAPMTAAEEVLTWLLVEKIGIQGGVGYSPNQAKDIIENRLSNEDPITTQSVLTDENVDRALSRWFSSKPEWASEMPERAAEKVRSEMRATLAFALLKNAGVAQLAAPQQIIQLPWTKTHHGKFWRAEVGGSVYEVFDDELADDMKHKCQIDFERKIGECLAASPNTSAGSSDVKANFSDERNQEIPKHVRDFLGKVQGVCMGVAMSGAAHPNPDAVLMELFNESQVILFPPSGG